ncbi:MAG TPA: cytochrome c oxidase assembly protein [Acidimicrobiales bacterium]
MTWWCSASTEPWSWSPRAYPGIWLFMALLLVGYLLAWRLAPATSDPASNRRKRWAFLGGWALLWLSTDWPLGTLGAGYLATAHMAQYVLYSTAAAPLLVLGLPEWMLRRALSRMRAYRAVSVLARPLVAGLVFNAVLLITHAPITVDNLRTNQFGSFALDLAWLLSGLLLWLPICGPLDELKPSLPARGVYLFLAAGLVPMVPGGFLTFSDTPLYAIYELAPRVNDFDALDDQQAAGAIMKIGNLPLVWPVLAGLFIKWANQERSTPPKVATPTT